MSAGGTLERRCENKGDILIPHSLHPHFPEKNREFAAVCGKFSGTLGKNREVLEQV
jgi:hypothetical protein